ncbi:hypothetical protein N7451_012371 [Penicillium sp. IBT 35674x]|nr:hypothetical protein N7451_012371 [Penicillium sp. IBT 35674x]
MGGELGVTWSSLLPSFRESDEVDSPRFWIGKSEVRSSTFKRIIVFHLTVPLTPLAVTLPRQSPASDHQVLAHTFPIHPSLLSRRGSFLDRETPVFQSFPRISPSAWNGTRCGSLQRIPNR